MAWGSDLAEQPVGQHICRLLVITRKQLQGAFYTGSKREVAMGSKVSSKMAAPTARVIQAVRPHAPLIKFPNRQGIPKPNAQEVLKTLVVNFQPHNSPGSPSAAAPPPLSIPHVPLTPIPGTPDTMASIQQLTSRYRRRPLTVEEMDYIQRGGPEWHEAIQPNLIRWRSVRVFNSVPQPKRA